MLNKLLDYLRQWPKEINDRKKWNYRLKVMLWLVLFWVCWVVGFQLGYWVGDGLFDEKIKYENL